MSVPLDDLDIEEGRRRRLSDYRGRYSDQLGVLNELRSDDSFTQTINGIIRDTLGSEEDFGFGDMGPPGENETTRNLRAMLEREVDGEGDLSMARSALDADDEPTFQFRIADQSRLSMARSEGQAEYPAYDDDDMEGQPDALMNLDIEDAFGEPEGWEDIEEAPVPGPDEPPQLNNEDDTIESEVEGLPQAASPQHHVEQSTRKLASATGARRQEKVLRISKLGVEYPSLPPTVVKKIASGFSRSCGGNGKMDKNTLSALSEASDWFFERLSEDLATYSTHAKRKTIEEADVITLMRR
jgi:histone H3/H4